MGRTKQRPSARWLKEQKIFHVEAQHCIVNISTAQGEDGKTFDIIEVMPDSFAGEGKYIVRANIKENYGNIQVVQAT